MEYMYPSGPPIPSGRSIAHHEFLGTKTVLISLDLETAGEYVGIVQLSAEICCLELIRHMNNKGKDSFKDTAEKIERNPNTFNKYVNPGDGMDWCTVAMGIHGLHRTHPSIVGADSIEIVWRQFEMWVHENVDSEETAILVAYNGATCDLKWIWKLTQAPQSLLNMPHKIKYFLDPYRVMKLYKRCLLNPSKSKTDGLELGTFWKFINGGENFNGAHDSLVDVKAQTDIVIHPKCVPFFDRK